VWKRLKTHRNSNVINTQWILLKAFEPYIYAVFEHVYNLKVEI